MDLTSLLSVMRGRLPRHLSTLLLAAAFLLTAGGEVFGQVVCPHHEVRQRGASPSAHESDGHAGHHGHDSETETSGAQPHGEHEAPCTCIGACHAGAATPLLPFEAAALQPAPVLIHAAVPVYVDQVGVSRSLLRLLPFANGPPRLA